MNETGIKKSRRQEKRLAREFKGRRQPGSGHFVGLKGDVLSPKYLFEAKYTDKKSYSLKLTTLEKIECEAARSQRIPVLTVCFGGREYFILRRMDFDVD